MVDLGIDHLGVTPADIGLPGEVSLKVAQDICRAVEDKIVTVALSVESSLEEIIYMVENVRPHILHLCGPEGDITPKMVEELKAKVDKKRISIKIMQAISVAGQESIDLSLIHI